MIVDYFGPNGLGYLPANPNHLTDWGGNATRINADINAGAFYMLHRDHGGETGWGEPDYDINDLSGLNNDDLCFVMSINCLTGKYDYSPECFTEAFHRMDKGALGLIAASNVSYSFVNDTFIWGLHDSMWPQFDPGYGGSTGDNELMPGFAQMSGKWYLSASSWPYNTSNKDETYNLFHMHGDAFTQLFSEVPQNLTVSHGSTVDNTATMFPVTADAGSLIACSAWGEVLGTAIAGSGVTNVTINPPMNPGIMYVTVTKKNHYRYEGQVSIQTGGPLAVFPSGSFPQSTMPGIDQDMDIMIIDGVETYVPGTGKIHYRFDPNDPFSDAVVVPKSGDIYTATLPGPNPRAVPEFYFSAQGSGGSVVTCPSDAPNTLYGMGLEPLAEVVFVDDFESDKGWTVQNTSISTGAFERKNPQGTDAQPEDDHSPDGTLCYVTGYLAGSGIGSYDVDGGPTRLISPTIDLSSGDADLSFYTYFYHSTNGTMQPLEIHMSNNDGSSWTLVEQINDSPSWIERNYTVSDYVTPTDKVKIRISANDNPNDSVVEALVDDFSIQRLNYDAHLWASAYDISVAVGADMNLFLDAGAGNGNRNYLVFGSLSGTMPGFALPGGEMVPLNWDIFTNFLLSMINSPVFQNFTGKLDATGQAMATLDTLGAMPAQLAGTNMHFAFVLNKPWDYVSNALAIELIP